MCHCSVLPFIVNINRCSRFHKAIFQSTSANCASRHTKNACKVSGASKFNCRCKNRWVNVNARSSGPSCPYTTGCLRWWRIGGI